MIILLILFLLWFLVLTIVVYGIVLLLTNFVEKIFFKSKTLDFKRGKQYRMFVIPTCFALGIFLNILYLSVNPSHNFKTAYIEKTSDKFIITIIGKRSLMAHDPISLFKKSTYIDSAKLELPRPEGKIDGPEVFFKGTNFEFLKGSEISLTKKSLTVNLKYINAYSKEISNFSWNGEYDLSWRIPK